MVSRCKKQCLAVSAATSVLVSSYYPVHPTIIIVQGRSMVPTLSDGKRYVLNRVVYLWQKPRRGDVAVFRDPHDNKAAVKRIIAIPGDSLLLTNNTIYLNGMRIPEPYLSLETRTKVVGSDKSAFTLCHNEYFVLGDNRAMSEDSRHYGPIRRDQIVGRVIKQF